MAKKSTWLKGAAAIGLVAFGLSQCESDDPYPDMAIAFNKHGAGFAARHSDIGQARTSVLDLCNRSPHRVGQSGCNIKFEFTGTAQQCINYGMYVGETGQMTFTALPYQRGDNENIALDTCNENDRNVCIPQQFSSLCND